MSSIETPNKAKIVTLKTPDGTEQLLPRTIVEAVSGLQEKIDASETAAKAASRPITWMPTADNVGAISITQKGTANGVAPLGSDNKVPSTYLPSYVDDVLEYVNKAAFPPVGESGKIYVDIAAGLTWRWGGSVYTEISPSIALGETASTAYRGDRGKEAYEHSLAKNNPHGVTAEQLGAVPTTEKGVAGGVATLGGDGKVVAGQMPPLNYDPKGSAAAVQTSLTAHTNNKSNPHGVTVGQIGAAMAGHGHGWNEVTGKPTTFTPTSHGHPWGEVTAKPTTFAPSAHTHATADTGPQLLNAYKVAGSFNWVAPVGVTKILVAMIGGGGGGGTGQHGDANYQYIDASGGASGCADVFELAVVPGRSYALVVGSGGAGASTAGYGADGKKGGSTAFGGKTVDGGDGGNTGNPHESNFRAAEPASGGQGTSGGAIVYGGIRLATGGESFSLNFLPRLTRWGVLPFVMCAGLSFTNETNNVLPSGNTCSLGTSGTVPPTKGTDPGCGGGCFRKLWSDSATKYSAAGCAGAVFIYKI